MAEKQQAGTVTPTPAPVQPIPAPAAPAGPPAAAVPKPAPVEVPAGAPVVDEKFQHLRNRVHEQVIAELDLGGTAAQNANTDQIRRAAEDVIKRVLAEEGIPLPAKKREILLTSVMWELVGYGPMQPLLDDRSISEVMVNSAKDIFVEQGGRLRRACIDGYYPMFDDNDHVRRIIDKILAPIGRRVNERTPMADGRLPDGSRVNVIIPPLALKGPSITIRKFSDKPLTADNLVGFGTMTDEMKDFLDACVHARLNIVISGGTGSGKTSTLNVMSAFIPSHERIVTVEDAAELRLHHENLVTLEARPPNIEGEGEVTIRDLVRNSLRMRPDRVVIGEVRGGECLDMLQAMNTGHDGSLATCHSNAPRDTISRLETMTLMAGMDLPIRVISKQIASAVQVIVHQSRLSDGSRRITHITEVQGMEGDTILLQDIFLFEQTGIDAEGKVIGRHRATGFRPKCMDQLITAGCKLPPSIFMS